MFSMTKAAAKVDPDFERENISISRSEYEYLQYCERKLDTLIDCGLEAWPHYLAAMGLLANRESRRPIDISRPRFPKIPRAA